MIYTTVPTHYEMFYQPPVSPEQLQSVLREAVNLRANPYQPLKCFISCFIRRINQQHPSFGQHLAINFIPKHISEQPLSQLLTRLFTQRLIPLHSHCQRVSIWSDNFPNVAGITLLLFLLDSFLSLRFITLILNLLEIDQMTLIKL